MANSVSTYQNVKTSDTVDMTGAASPLSSGDARSVLKARSVLAARLWRAADLQAADIEARLAAGPRPAAESERDARVLSVLAKTLRELSVIDDAMREEDDDGEDTASDDLETLREELGVRLRRINQERTGLGQPCASKNN